MPTRLAPTKLLFASLALALSFSATALHAQEGYPEQPQDAQQADPPSVVARISVLDGNVSFQPASITDFTAAELNYPLTTGDRLYTDVGSDAELQADQLAVQMGAQTDFTVTAMTDQLAQFGLAQGSVHLHTFSFDPNATIELDTPNVALTMLSAGDVRVDVYPDSDTTVMTLFAGHAQVDADGYQQVLQPGESVELAGANPVRAQDIQRVPPDGLDQFAEQRDAAFQQGYAGENAYLNADTIGGDDLNNYGDWDNSTSDYGICWYPRDVPVDWQPYRYGHWAWIAPWGWTWVETEPWGFAPFHYGRWVHNGNRWGWIPGPIVVRPVYAPALVVFAGGAGFAIGGTTGVTAWFPLGPREPFVPWYHTSIVYENRVNITNIYSRNTMEVHRVYNERNEQVYGGDNTNRVYANRTIATVAVPQQAFAAGRSVSQTMLHVPPAQLAAAPVIAHPQITPVRTIIARVPARALPVQVKRPVLETHVDAPREPGQTAPIVRTPPVYRSPVATTAPTPTPIKTTTVVPVTQHPASEIPPLRTTQPQQPAQTPTPPAPRTPQPVAERPEPVRSEPARPQTMPFEPAARPLVNRSVPPQPRPSFDEQQKAIESTEPGRPLSPQQMTAVRNNQPVPSQPKPGVHAEAAPANRPAPPAAKEEKKH